MTLLNLKTIVVGAASTATLVGCGSATMKSERQNVLIVVLDDVGFSDIQPLGSEINTPNINALAEQGKLFTRFHTSPLSAPARSLILTGVDNHLNGLGNMPPAQSSNQYMQSGYEGYLSESVMTTAEILREAGYYTCMSGKWHLGMDQHDPYNRGFDRSFALIGGGASHFSNAFVLFEDEIPVTYYSENGVRVEQLPDDFYSSKNYADKMIEYIDDCPDEKPLFGYLTFTAAHDPLHVPADWMAKYRGRYDEGYEAIRRERYERLLQRGIITHETELNHSIESSNQWDKLSDADRAEQARRMEIYAAMIEYADMSLGRVIDHLKSSGRYDNTVIFLMSDNGANPGEAWEYPGGSKEEHDKKYNNTLDNIGACDSYVSLGQSWAEICDTPYSLFKYTTKEGGICTPLIVAGGGAKGGTIDTHSMLHATDLLPTILDYTGASRPTHRNGVELLPLYGKSMAKLLNDPAHTHRGEQDLLCFEMIENKAVIRGDWKAVLLIPPYGDGKSWALYNMKSDLIECVDQAAQYPELVAELVAEWEAYAKRVGYIEANGEEMVDVVGYKRFYSYDPSLRMKND